MMTELVEYTDWQRLQWHRWILQQENNVLELPAGTHGDGRFETIGELIRHMFSAEIRYIQRLTKQPITDYSTIPPHDAKAVFSLGELSRMELRTYSANLAPEQWDESMRLPLLDYTISATPRKILMHVLLHEVRHWAQIATMLRLAGYKVEGHDFILSPVLGELSREQVHG